MKYVGADLVASQFSSAWAPISAERTGSRKQVVWEGAGVDRYKIWNTDNSGNLVSVYGPVSGSDSTLRSLEPSFQQDLNHDGLMGFPTTVIEIGRASCRERV